MGRSAGVAKRSLLYRALVYAVTSIDNRTGLVSLLSLPLVARRLRAVRGVDEAISFLFSDSLSAKLIEPMQVREEIEALARLVADMRPRVVVEIGTARGGTLFIWTRAAAPDALIVSIDLPGGLFGGGYPRAKTPLYRRFALPGQELYLLRGDSHSAETLRRLKEILRGRSIDFLFIDGDHRYEGVKRDYELYSPLVRSGGMIAFHDIVPGPPERVGGVPRFWRELKQRLPHGKYLEIVRDWGQGGYGIGVVFK